MTGLTDFMRYCERRTERRFADYAAFDTFAVSQFRTFWSLFLDWSQIISDGDREPVCTSDDCETAVFFPALRLNYAENLLRGGTGNALIGCHADGSRDVLSGNQVRDKVIQFAVFLRQLGIKPGDIVTAIARNNVEVAIVALSTAAIGAIFSSCAHDMGALTILSRFQKLKPKILVANCASQAWDAGKPLAERIGEVIAGLPTLTAIIALDGTLPSTLPLYDFGEITAGMVPDFAWELFPFNHPLFILFSSGTTGTPKCIVHGAGGTLLEHVKEHRLHGDLGNRDRMFFQTSCGWMMWNWQLSALACGAEVVTYDGPLKGPETLWDLVAEQQVTVFGTSPAYLQFSEMSGYSPRLLNLTALRVILSTGSILYPRHFDWILQQVKDIPVQSISGGTDILGCFVLGNPLLPVHHGQAQCRSLGLDVRSLRAPESLSPIGELICANPLPSRPIGFYGENSTQRYHDAYFMQNPGVWTHGDLIEITSTGITLHGRSDGVINVRGVRIGPAEIYRILQQIPIVVESMAVEQSDELQAGGTRLILLVVLQPGSSLNDDLVSQIRATLAEQGSLVMVPSAIVQVDAMPITYSGKRSEAAARDAVNGRSVRNRAALLNPECLDGLAEKLSPAKFTTVPCHGDLETNLCAICQRHLGVPVRPTDNFLALGGDSLTILGFLLEVTALPKMVTPLASMMGVSTVRALAAIISRNILPPRTPSRSIPELRSVEPDDEDAISAILDSGFRRKLPWRRIFEHPWQPDAIPRGFMLTAKDKIVGFLGLICARRTLNGKTGVVGNLTSWYVDPDFRGWSNALIAAATQFDISYTSFTPGKVSQQILGAVGFSALDTRKVYSPPLMHANTLRVKKPTLIFHPEMLRPKISKEESRILDDHAQYECLPLLLIDGGETAFAMVGRRFYRPHNYGVLRYSEILFCNHPALINRHLERVTLAVMSRQRTVGLTLSKHMSPSAVGVEVPTATMFRSNTFVPCELDRLYSELTLLPV